MVAALGISRAASEQGAARARLSVVGPEESGLGADAVALPAEECLIVRIALPLASHRQRQAAAGFAVEDLIAEPIEASHVVLGPEVGPREYLAFVVSHAAMAPRAARANKLRGRLVPDVLALPVPSPGSCSVREAFGRVMVRRPDGTGFAAPSRGLRGAVAGRRRAAGRALRRPAAGRHPGRRQRPDAGDAHRRSPGGRPAAGSLYPRQPRAGAASFPASRAIALLALAAHGVTYAADTYALDAGSPARARPRSAASSPPGCPG